MPWSAVNRLLLGLWVCHGINITGYALGRHRLVLLCMFVLLRAVQGAISIEVLSVSFSPARDLGSSRSFAVDSDQLRFSGLSGNRSYSINDSSIERQRLIDSELVAGLACVVHRCNGAENWQTSWTELNGS